jgi:hypothetical protein
MMIRRGKNIIVIHEGGLVLGADWFRDFVV